MKPSTLNQKEKLNLKQQAHHLNPVVMIGQNGLSNAIIHEVDNALNAHELIKIRVLGDDRDERITIAATLCETLEAELIQHIGKLLVLWRKNPEKNTKKNA